MAAVRTRVADRLSGLLGTRRARVQSAILASVILAGIAAGSVSVLTRSSGPLYGCSSVSDCRSVAIGHGLKPLMLPNGKEAGLRFHDGAVEVDQGGRVDLAVSFVDSTHAVSTLVLLSAGVHELWGSICSLSKANQRLTSSGVHYCSVVEYCSGKAVLVSRGVSYSVDIYGKQGCASDFSSQTSSRLEEIVNSFS